MQIAYRSKYKYQLAATYSVPVGIKPAETASSDFIELDAEGLLTIRKGYAWDGATGLAFDTRNFMRASLVHDALYELMRNKLISCEHRQQVDRQFRDIALEDGMSPARINIHYFVLRVFGGRFASPKYRRKVRTAP